MSPRRAAAGTGGTLGLVPSPGMELRFPQVLFLPCYFIQTHLGVGTKQEQGQAVG